jgi:hypothetical protein
MSLEAATWVTAAATVILAVFAVVTARYARRAYVAQSAQLDDQRKELQQAAAGRDRDAAERHRAQALQVYLRREYVSPMYDLDPPQIARPRAQHKPAADLRPAIRVAPCRQALLHVRRAHHVADAVRHARRGRTWHRRRPRIQSGLASLGSRPPSATAPERGGAHGRTASSRRYPSRRM